ncbi:MAG: hypothetical protein N3G21_03445, partial [Candidatus Hydrogenedentes bacterium]|nr:hypothetical protein [Candidatus Hydrogenedentota bacterium]
VERIMNAIATKVVTKFLLILSVFIFFSLSLGVRFINCGTLVEMYQPLSAPLILSKSIFFNFL